MSTLYYCSSKKIKIVLKYLPICILLGWYWWTYWRRSWSVIVCSFRTCIVATSRGVRWIEKKKRRRCRRSNEQTWEIGMLKNFSHTRILLSHSSRYCKENAVSIITIYYSMFILFTNNRTEHCFVREGSTVLSILDFQTTKQWSTLLKNVWVRKPQLLRTVFSNTKRQRTSLCLFKMKSLFV